jgi:two-component system nitrate/nitrite sensor histidine kinase NarQ
MIFLTQLFSVMEDMQEELREARGVKAALEEREKIARELHDGIAQSLFLLAVQVDLLDKRNAGDTSEIQTFRQTVHEVNGYVRQAIANLRYPASSGSLPWLELMRSLPADFTAETGIPVDWRWTLTEEELSAKERVELYASVREALLNIRKHADARQVWISAEESRTEWTCTVLDDGTGFDEQSLRKPDKFGLQIMRERAEEMGWTFELITEQSKTVFRIQKKGER